MKEEIVNREMENQELSGMMNNVRSTKGEFIANVIHITTYLLNNFRKLGSRLLFNVGPNELVDFLHLSNLLLFT